MNYVDTKYYKNITLTLKWDLTRVENMCYSQVKIDVEFGRILVDMVVCGSIRVIFPILRIPYRELYT